MKPILHAAAFALLASPSLACDSTVTLTNDQVRDSLAMLADESSAGFSKFLAFQTLSCSDQSVIRQFGVEAALASGESALQAAVLFELMMSRETLVLRPEDSDEMTEEERDWARANPFVRYGFFGWDRENSCIALTHNRDCRRDGVADVSGTNVTLFTRSNTAELSIEPDGSLRGHFFPGSGLQIPVVADLF